ncbi:hypothetical protein RRG08_060174 [Elysia crispata]|uniref:Uncharacterized protein n=1 Tax=Elysia crispata TaxID=231223 RepID=A0AAE0ZZN2_9GAST|nr:hypothetical protein RRG08_060174 [Elysia crispata]
MSDTHQESNFFMSTFSAKTKTVARHYFPQVANCKNALYKRRVFFQVSSNQDLTNLWVGTRSTRDAVWSCDLYHVELRDGVTYLDASDAWLIKLLIVTQTAQRFPFPRRRRLVDAVCTAADEASNLDLILPQSHMTCRMLSVVQVNLQSRPVPQCNQTTE